MKTNRHLVLAALQRHIGMGNGIKGRDLAARLGCSGRELRDHISELIFRDQVHIGGRPTTGYFIAEQPAELVDTVKFHHKRGLHELKKASVLSGKPLLELAGQEQLDI